MTDNLFSDALNKDGRNLSRLAADQKLTLPRFRESQVAAVLASLRNNRSVLLVGETGVGKTAVLHGVAAELPRGAGSVVSLELLNRFQHIVTFDGLTRENGRRIARREIQQLLAREGIKPAEFHQLLCERIDVAGTQPRPFHLRPST